MSLWPGRADLGELHSRSLLGNSTNTQWHVGKFRRGQADPRHCGSGDVGTALHTLYTNPEAEAEGFHRGWCVF
jgi:hypothetical protein